VRAGDGLQACGDVPKLRLGQSPRKVLANTSQVRRRSSPHDLAPMIGQPGEHDPRVSLDSFPSDEAVSHESVHHPGEPARRHHDPAREFRHPERSVRRSREANQHVVVAEGEFVLRSEFGVELADRVIMGMKERLPRSEFRLAQLRRHASSLATDSCIRKYPADILHSATVVERRMLGGVSEMFSQAMAGLTLGVALAGAPGPVQAVLLSEAIRGGMGRGFRALIGVHLTFGILLVGLALGLSLAPPSGLALRVLKVAGGAYLLWLALEGLRSARGMNPGSAERRTLPPAVRGALAIVLNPGGWLFLAAVASPLLASAGSRSGTGSALLMAGALVTGAAIGDGAVVVAGGVGVRRAGEGVGRWVRRALAIVLAGLGVWLLVSGLIS
jgi:threonine/homoserine/homoserine lactone efflux protein